MSSSCKVMTFCSSCHFFNDILLLHLRVSSSYVCCHHHTSTTPHPISLLYVVIVHRHHASRQRHCCVMNTWLHINISPGQLLAVHPVSVQVVVQCTCLLLVGCLITSSRAAAIGWTTHYVTARDCYWLMALAGHYKSRSTAVDQDSGWAARVGRTSH